jgi:rhodanese-related sulfurtransferase
MFIYLSSIQSILKSMKTRPSFTAFIVACSLFVFGCTASQAGPSVTLEDARTALSTSSAVVIDIRETSEHATGVAKGARLIPMGQLGKRLNELPKPGEQSLLIICNTQNRSSKIVEQLQAAGFTNASYVQGGMSQWAERGWTMVKPTP